LLAAVIFGGLVLVAALVAPPLASPTPGVELAAGVVIAVASLPALALLGAGLTSAALGSRASAASAGLAMALGAPVAAVTSAMICMFVLVALAPVHLDGLDTAGRVLRVGVLTGRSVGARQATPPGLRYPTRTEPGAARSTHRPTWR
jgi:hypothetical protein